MDQTVASNTSPTTGPDFAQLVRAMPSQYMILDRNLVYVEANPAYCASVERSRDEIVGRYVFEAFPPTGEGDGRSRNRCGASSSPASRKHCRWPPIQSRRRRAAFA